MKTFVIFIAFLAFGVAVDDAAKIKDLLQQRVKLVAQLEAIDAQLTAVAVKTKPSVGGSSFKLLDEYKRNPVNADALFKDKVIWTAGRVSAITTEYVYLEPTQQLDEQPKDPVQAFLQRTDVGGSLVQCRIGRDFLEIVKGLKPGDTIGVVGLCTGQSTDWARNVNVIGCSAKLLESAPK